LDIFAYCEHLFRVFFHINHEIRVLDKISFPKPPQEEFVGESFPSTSISLYARKNKHAKRYEQFDVVYVRFVRQLFLDAL